MGQLVGMGHRLQRMQLSVSYVLKILFEKLDSNGFWLGFIKIKFFDFKNYKNKEPRG